MHPALTYGLLGLFAATFVFAFWVDGRGADSRLYRLRKFSLVVQLAALAGAYLTLRPGRGVDGRAAVAASLAAGRPVLIELFSNY